MATRDIVKELASLITPTGGRTPLSEVLKYSPDQARDERGRFTSSGDGGSGSTPTSDQEQPIDFHPHETSIFGTFQLDPNEVADYLADGGKAYRGSPLPKGIDKGVPNECYANATNLLFGAYYGKEHPDWRYCEGIAAMANDPSMSIMHGWIVDGQGKVIDNSLKDPQNWVYYGRTYETKPYIDFCMEHGYYGVLGGDPAAAEEVMLAGGI
jgi:hypothetical protein